jgi:hypothetical protein
MGTTARRSHAARIALRSQVCGSHRISPHLSIALSSKLGKPAALLQQYTNTGVGNEDVGIRLTAWLGRARLDSTRDVGDAVRSYEQTSFRAQLTSSTCNAAYKPHGEQDTWKTSAHVGHASTPRSYPQSTQTDSQRPWISSDLPASRRHRNRRLSEDTTATEGRYTNTGAESATKRRR